MLEKKFTVKGAKWTCAVVTPAQYKKSHGEESEGICSRDKKVVTISADHFTILTLKHEIFHAFVGECHGHMIDLTGEQMEELAAEIISYHSKDIEEIADTLFNTLGPKIEKEKITK